MDFREIAMLEVCRDTRKCFASRAFRGRRKCSILNKTYLKDGECPYCKSVAEVTDGKRYEYNIFYKEKEDE